MPAGRVVAAAHVTALEAEAEMDPGLSGRKALLTAVDRFREVVKLDVARMAAQDHHHPTCLPLGARRHIARSRVLFLDLAKSDSRAEDAGRRPISPGKSVAEGYISAASGQSG
jgi:hypothetical protein